MTDWNDPKNHDVYFAVPDHYTIGRKFTTWRAAAAFAATKHPAGRVVDIRLVDGTGDRPVARVRVPAS